MCSNRNAGMPTSSGNNLGRAELASPLSQRFWPEDGGEEWVGHTVEAAAETIVACPGAQRL